MKDPYEVLGLSREATEEELTNKYNELKATYGEQRFLPGDEGNEGAKKLTELEEAWQIIWSDLRKAESKTVYGGDLGAIDDLIKKQQYDEAQKMLDEISDRSAEWHYLQSIIYYKRDWLTDSQTQLKLAIEMEPFNTKYKTALEKLNMVMGNPQADPTQLGADPAQPVQPDGQGQMCGGNMLSNCCLAYCCTDCCCTMTRCCG